MRDIWYRSVKGTPRMGPEAGSSGTPPTVLSSECTSNESPDREPDQVDSAASCREAAEAIAHSSGGRIVQPDMWDTIDYLWCILKHWFGVHTFIDVYYWDMESGSVTYTGQECRRCALPA
jgi:hypothetical protein